MPKGIYIRTKPAWNKGLKRTEEEKAKQKQTVLDKYGVDNVCKIPIIKDKLNKIRKSDNFKIKVKQTKKLRYNDPNYNNMVKNKLTKLKRYNNEYYNNMEKNIETKRKNNSFNSSKIEKIVFNYLNNKYGQNDIIKEYKDIRYPFYCDFYIKSQDKFIELNIHPCHNFKEYNIKNDKNELKQLKLKSQNSDYYKNIIKVWTESDPLKFKYAKENNLNYKVYYNKKDVEYDINNNIL